MSEIQYERPSTDKEQAGGGGGGGGVRGVLVHTYLRRLVSLLVAFRMSKKGSTYFEITMRVDSTVHVMTHNIHANAKARRSAKKNKTCLYHIIPWTAHGKTADSPVCKSNAPRAQGLGPFHFFIVSGCGLPGMTQDTSPSDELLGIMKVRHETFRWTTLHEKRSSRADSIYEMTLQLNQQPLRGLENTSTSNSYRLL